MDVLRRWLFEDPLPLYALLGVAELVIVGLWYRRRGRRLAVALLAPPVLAAMVFAADVLVETDRERLQAILRQIARDAQEGDLEAVADCLADDFYGQYVSRSAAVQAAREAREAYGIRSIRVSAAQVQVQDGAATAHVRTVLSYDHPQYGSGRQVLDWTVHWGKRNGAWRIVSVEGPRPAVGL